MSDNFRLNTTREERDALLTKLTEARFRWKGSPFQSMEREFSVDVCKLLQDSLMLEDELARVRDNFDKVTRKLNDAAVAKALNDLGARVADCEATSQMQRGFK